MAVICVFGDSIAYGAVDSEGGGWVSRLRKHYEAQGLRIDQDTDVYNLGISGDNTEDLLKRFDAEVAARQPDTILFAIGINDSQFVISKQTNRVSLEKFIENMKMLIEKAKKIAKRVVIVGLTSVHEVKTTPVPWNTDKEYRNDYITQYDNALQAIAGQHEVSFVSVREVLTPEELEDGLHPNTAGHIKLFEVITRGIA